MISARKILAALAITAAAISASASGASATAAPAASAAPTHFSLHLAASPAVERASTIEPVPASVCATVRSAQVKAGQAPMAKCEVTLTLTNRPGAVSANGWQEDTTSATACYNDGAVPGTGDSGTNCYIGSEQINSHLEYNTSTRVFISQTNNCPSNSMVGVNVSLTWCAYDGQNSANLSTGGNWNWSSSPIGGSETSYLRLYFSWFQSGGQWWVNINQAAYWDN